MALVAESKCRSSSSSLGLALNLSWASHIRTHARTHAHAHTHRKHRHTHRHGRAHMRARTHACAWSTESGAASLHAQPRHNRALPADSAAVVGTRTTVFFSLLLPAGSCETDFSAYPDCQWALDYMFANWQHPDYEYYKLKGTRCSLQGYLNAVENKCPACVCGGAGLWLLLVPARASSSSSSSSSCPGGGCCMSGFLPRCPNWQPRDLPPRNDGRPSRPPPCATTDRPLIKRCFFLSEHRLTTTTWSTSEASLVAARGKNSDTARGPQVGWWYGIGC